jgi:hypothetical protein
VHRRRDVPGRCVGQRHAGRHASNRRVPSGSPVRDPARPTDLYVGGSDSGLWKSTDYGNTWKNIATTDDVPDAPRGVVFAVSAHQCSENARFEENTQNAKATATARPSAKP